MTFEILCDNKSSYQIAVNDGSVYRPKYGKPVVLVRCDRTDTEDNERGLKLAQKITDLLNSLPEQEQKALLADEMIPVMRG